MYANGQGVPQDDKAALKWFRLAVKQGDEEAQAAIDEMYTDGRVAD
jgi:TPR repeat protein